MSAVLVSTPLGSQLYQVILERILNGIYAPGQRLFPDHLRTEFGVSITPVRDAIQRLKLDGFVQVHARQGVYVATLDAKRVRNIYDLRIALESLAARLAAPYIPADVLTALQQRFVSAEAEFATTADEQALFRVAPCVHEVIADYCDNEPLRQILTTTKQQNRWAGSIAARQASRATRTSSSSSARRWP